MRLFLDMTLEEAGGGGGRLRSSGEAWPLRRDVDPAEQFFNTPVDEGPRTHILRLFLAPDDLGITVALQHLAERVEREGVELLDPDKRDRVVMVLRTCLVQIEIDLA